MNYVDYSRKSFVEFHKALGLGFVRFKNDEDYKIYVSRLGLLYSWEHKDGVIISTETAFPVPGALTHEDFDWLRGIAKNVYRWSGGVKKLNYYETLTPEELNARGIDPYFYAWMFIHKYEPTKGVEIGWPERVLQKDEYDDLISSVNERGEDEQDALMVSLINFKCGGGSYIGWCHVQAIKSRKEELKARIEALVEDFSPSDREISIEEKETAKKEIYAIVEKLLSKV